MIYRNMEEKDVDSVVDFYMGYYNRYEDGCWTKERARRRIHPICTREDACCVLAKEDGRLAGRMLSERCTSAFIAVMQPDSNMQKQISLFICFIVLKLLDKGPCRPWVKSFLIFLCLRWLLWSGGSRR